MRSFSTRHKRLTELRRMFDAEIYADIYLGSPKLKRLSLLHYLAIGERLGCRPNPFFDPLHFAEATGGVHRSLFDYLDRYAQREVSPSREFEHGWYSRQNPDWSQNYSHPFLHYCLEGLDQGRDPAPGIDVTKLKTAVAHRYAKLMGYLHEQVVKQGRFDPFFATYTHEELLRAQEAFKSTVALHIHRESETRNRRFLVFVQTNRTLDRTYLGPDRDFDLLLNFYDGPPCSEWPGVEFLLSQRGTKTTAVAKLLETRPDILLRYDAVLFLDDDIGLSPSELATFFTEMEYAGLDLAQPSLTAESHCVWQIFKQPLVGPSVRSVNAVEIMMPAVSRFALKEAGWTFGRSISGFGVDLLLGREVVSRLGRKAGVIGSVVAVHEKAIDDRTGSFYTFMRSININPKYELWALENEFGFKASFVYND